MYESDAQTDLSFKNRRKSASSVSQKDLFCLGLKALCLTLFWFAVVLFPLWVSLIPEHSRPEFVNNYLTRLSKNWYEALLIPLVIPVFLVTVFVGFVGFSFFRFG